MSDPPKPERAPIGSFLIFGVPIALALSLIPALMVVIPVRQAVQQGSQPVVASNSQSQQSASQVHLTVKEWSFQPSTLQLPVGKPVTLVLDNRGQLDHDVTIPSLGINLKAGAGKTWS